MASVDLNIIDRGIEGTDWSAQLTGIQASQLDKIKEQRTDNGDALNSLPTPFARFFVVQEAFRRLTEERRHAENAAGVAYQRLVSDCLDVYELLFNFKFHTNILAAGNMKIVIKEWDYKAQMGELKTHVPKLYNAVESSYNIDIKENTLYFVVLDNGGKEILLATSSPMTGFVTPPDMDKKNGTSNIRHKSGKYDEISLKRKEDGFYFNEILLFEDRTPEFKNYMFGLFGTASMDERLCVIRDYIHTFENDPQIVNNYNLITKNVMTENNSSVIINGLNIKYNDEVDIDSFFRPNLIKLPYKLNAGNFIGMSYENDDPNRDYDFLLPFKSEVLPYLYNGAVCTCQIRKNDVVVKLTIDGKEYSKTYDTDEDINDLRKNNQVINIGLFPNILSTVEAENDYFKLALSVADNSQEYKSLTIDNTSLSFYKENGNGKYVKIEEALKENGAQCGVNKPVVRSRQQPDEPDYSTKYYELFNTVFDAVEISIGSDCGLVLPRWQKATRTNDSFTYAIDLGTSNTFISRTGNNDSYVPEMFSMDRPMVSYLHESNKSTQYSLVANTEDAMAENTRKAMQTEYVPPFIDGLTYKFPIRTAICKNSLTAEQPSLFDNHNIAFFYTKMRENQFQECVTDIKWKDNLDEIKIFIRELLLIIKCDVLARNGVLAQTNIVWFRPLSFSGKAKNEYEKIWKELTAQVLFSNNVRCYTESEAPYYYFNKKDVIRNTDTVTVIDIGGGSTDYVHFSENKPILATSVHFGCDVMWSNGHSGFENDKQNGIYKKYAGKLNWRNGEEQQYLESYMETGKASTTDIINFWLEWQKRNDIVESLHNDYLPLFVYHFTALVYYIAKLYKYKRLGAPRTMVFSGNGSKYIDSFITNDTSVISEMITEIFNKVYGTVVPIHVIMPDNRKESTCYGGLYRSNEIGNVPAIVYHGIDKEYENVGQMNDDSDLQKQLLKLYGELNVIYNDMLNILKRKDIIDNSTEINKFKVKVNEGYENHLSNHYRSEVKEKFEADDVLHDSVFFIPVVDKIFELTNLK